ncbi:MULTISPECIES: hypothetical protein [unclassified Sphingopyxis]|uniref:hypothetical protein n=1 Tax=unclassified Sphingopyxis TaxID=2614943 RepID=UPI000735FACB|nr:MULTISPECIES: hypothetical protein [unclassified Sphingopyxis]KTE34324.1 hypothetical protein ATE62_16180 [Sphingopyxis sp. HIX]KTE80432.1 hypothetical protein ATE72_18025 [Sphingopyxis sp. HXXIV]
MLDFLWHLRGTVVLDMAMPDEEVFDRLHAMLVGQEKPVTPDDGRQIGFDAPLWRNLYGSNWRAMVIYDRGDFWLDRQNGRRVLRYDLRSLHTFIFCLGAAGLFFSAGSSGSLEQGVKLAGLALGWLYGMNLLLASLRVPRLIRRMLR